MELIIVFTIIFVIAGVILWKKMKANRQNGHRTTTTNETNAQPVTVTDASETETGPMVYYANDRNGSRDKEYRFNYKKINDAWRAYILRMPSLGSRDAGSIATHRLWDDNNNPYICWDSKVTSLSDMQNISREWADCIQEYKASGKRFGPE